MEEAIKNFHTQFGYRPEIKNSEKLTTYDHYILDGMGGSHLAGDLLKIYQPGIELYIHKDYGLPPFDEAFLHESLLIASSYSGNTEETLDFLEEGYSRGFKMAVISTGGKLIDFAIKNQLPYIQLPEVGIQPRSALGYSILAIVKMLGREDIVAQLYELETLLDPSSFRKQGEDLATSLAGKIPVIYSSAHNLGIAYNWKIKLNETGKIPAFYNILPELNHNEMNSFHPTEKTAPLLDRFHFIFLHDPEDDQRIEKRMNVAESLYEQDGLGVTHLISQGQTTFEKIFNSLILADWVAYTIAVQNGVDPEGVPVIEDFKAKLKEQ